MSCECRERINGLLLERLREQFPNSEDHKASLAGYAMIFGDGEVKSKPYMPTELSHVVTAKNGNKRTKKEKMNFMFTHCPFCGVGLDK